MAAMDATDRKILTLLQDNAAQPVAEVARKVGLSVTPCWRRIQRLEEMGVIRKRVALLDPQKIGVGSLQILEWKRLLTGLISSLLRQVIPHRKRRRKLDFLHREG